MILDTNILIAYLNGEKNVRQFIDNWRRADRLFFISSISIAETLALPKLSPNEIDIIKQFLDDFVSIPFDNDTAEIAAFLARKYRIKIPDAAIAATALSNNVPLVSRDQQFQKIEGLTIVQL